MWPKLSGVNKGGIDLDNLGGFDNASYHNPD